ncbi:UNVERIFIED_CONTAM: unc-10 [Trichonephila clavipes]
MNNGECEVVGAQWKKEDILDAKIKKFLSQPPNWRPSKDNYRMIRQMMLKLPYKEGVDPSNAAAMVGLRIMGGRLLDAGHVGAVVEKVVRGSTADTIGQIRPGKKFFPCHKCVCHACVLLLISCYLSKLHP